MTGRALSLQCYSHLGITSFCLLLWIIIFQWLFPGMWSALGRKRLFTVYFSLRTPITLYNNYITKDTVLYLFIHLFLLCSPQPVKEDIATPLPSEKTPTSVNQTPIETNEFPQLPEGLEKKPLVLKFSTMLDGIAIGAALLPSLRAEYKMGRMRSHGMTGSSHIRTRSRSVHWSRG